MNYLSADDIVFIHDVIIKEIGGSFGIREPGLLVSIVEKPKTTFGDQEVYPDIFIKAASLYEALCNYHVFIDGNKRTSVIAMYRFLYQNGYTLTANNKEIEDFTIYIATSNPDLADIATWIQQHSKKRETS